MKKSPRYLWVNALVAEFIEGCADAFLVAAGGAAVAGTGAAGLPAVTPGQLATSVLIGGVWYVASFLKKTPTPASMPLSSEQPNLPVQ